MRQSAPVAGRLSSASLAPIRIQALAHVGQAGHRRRAGLALRRGYPGELLEFTNKIRLVMKSGVGKIAPAG
jgi:hypothetical protein